MRRRQVETQAGLSDVERGQIAGLWAVARKDDEARQRLAELLRGLAPGAMYAVRLGAWEEAESRIGALLTVTADV